MTEFAESPALPQEKSGESKVPQEQERTSIFRWLRDRWLLIYMATALSVTTPFKHERVEAADIPPGASWMEGIQTLRKGVLYDQVETQVTFFIDKQTHRGKWIVGKEGTPTRAEVSTTDIVDAVESELSAHPTQSITVCHLHTHPLSGAEATGWISAEESRDVRKGKHSVSIPPSDEDISFWHAGIEESAITKFREKGITVEAREGVIDPAGIIYFNLHPIKDQDIKQIKQEFPGMFAELEHRRAVLREWEEAVNLAVDNLDAVTVNKLHNQIPMDLDRHHRLYRGSYSEQEQLAFKRRDIKETVISGSWIDAIAPVLFAGNPKAQRLQHIFKTQVLGKRSSDMDILAKARFAFSKTSTTVAPERLTSTQEYVKLREAFALIGSKIRFVPYIQVSSEPPCAGTDYKP